MSAGLIKSRRIITFVPAEQAEKFATSIAEHIPYLFGDYDSVCWWSEPKLESGTEQFRPLKGTLQSVPSVRMEFSIPADDEAQVQFIEKLTELHPWEQPVILIADTDVAVFGR